MGSELTRRGVSTLGEAWSAYAIETAPDVIEQIHRDHARDGARVHRTNTFRAQPRLFPDRWEAMVRKAILLARSGGGRIAGSIAPVFDCYRPDLSPGEASRAAHAAMANAFEGVDLLICETFPSAVEARVAVEEAVKTRKETWVALTAGPDGTLLTPSQLAAAARDCVHAGAGAVLVCCTGASLTLPYVEALSTLGVPFGAYANGGDDYNGSHERYAAFARTWVDVGASLVGACCGASISGLKSMNV